MTCGDGALLPFVACLASFVSFVLLVPLVPLTPASCNDFVVNEWTDCSCRVRLAREVDRIVGKVFAIG